MANDLYRQFKKVFGNGLFITPQLYWEYSLVWGMVNYVQGVLDLTVWSPPGSHLEVGCHFIHKWVLLFLIQKLQSHIGVVDRVIVVFKSFLFYSVYCYLHKKRNNKRMCQNNNNNFDGHLLY
jgi:hypothetical protein